MKAFASVMDDYTPLSEDVCVLTDQDEPIVVVLVNVTTYQRQLQSKFSTRI